MERVKVQSLTALSRLDKQVSKQRHPARIHTLRYLLFPLLHPNTSWFENAVHSSPAAQEQEWLTAVLGELIASEQIKEDKLDRKWDWSIKLMACTETYFLQLEPASHKQPGTKCSNPGACQWHSILKLWQCQKEQGGKSRLSGDKHTTCKVTEVRIRVRHDLKARVK